MKQQSLKRCPIGIQTFEEIINKDYLYIDKTEYVYRMAYGASKYYFLSRPRRFGKSLLTSTLHCYFTGKKDLFKGLAIEKLETEWTEYPVLHFDMSLAKHVDKETLESMLDVQLFEHEKIYGKPERAVTLNDRMKTLIMRAYEQTGRQVVVLIDEYDAPLLDVVHEDENLPVLRNVMRNFYSPLKACDPYLRFVFLTGITKFSQLSIFSELNNIKNISMDEPYAAICGITKEEMLEQMGGYIERFALSQEMSKEDTLLKLQEKYEYVLLEGAGGLMVPVDHQILTIDYIRQHQYPVILVTNGRLGSINHTLLSLSACRQYGIEVAALVYNQYPKEDAEIEKNTLDYLKERLPQLPIILLPDATRENSLPEVASLL